MKLNKNVKYIAIKVEGINHWLWFEQEKVIRENGMFEGNEGWGKGGSLTSISISENNIVGEMYSESPQYS